MLENYSKKIKKVLSEHEICIGDEIKITTENRVYRGILMPHTKLNSSSCVILKLNNGYNFGLELLNNIKIEKIRTGHNLKKQNNIKKIQKISGCNISILGCGGTIASRIDYRTGAVSPSLSPEDILENIPELHCIANFSYKKLFDVFSENMTSEHWKLISNQISKEIKNGVDGIIIMHGTDTMHYTAAALSFMLRDLPIPVLLVGAQRSVDRGSCDAGMNLICAANFIANTNFGDVGICMHGTINDDFCLINSGCRTRKMHSSSRNAFRPINSLPCAKVWLNNKIEFLDKSYNIRNYNKKLKLINGFEKKVGLIKVSPDFDFDILKYYIHEKYRGLIIEGTGLGHLPKNAFKKLKELIKIGCVVIMTSQTIYGTVNMNVYSTGRYLCDIGVISCKNILSEVAYVKLKWILAQFSDLDEIKNNMMKNYANEFIDHVNMRTFLY